jgi:phosphatidate cytidylyltransferase
LKYQREVTAAVLIPVVIAILIAGRGGWAVLVAVASSLALLEFYGLIRAAGWIVPRNVGLALLLGFLAAAYLQEESLLLGLAGMCLFALPTLVMFASPPEAVLFPSASSSVFATLYVAAGGASMIGIRAISWIPVLFLLVIVWAGDSAAYYVGRRWGRRKLAPVVSPKKTWAGLGGQLVAGTLLGMVSGLCLREARLVVLLGGLGLVVSGAAVVGDLVESTFKRSCSVKDSGGLLPGHGGMLDRLDSLLYAAPVAFLILTFVPGAIALVPGGQR